VLFHVSLNSSVAGYHFDAYADPDSAFHFDADPDPDPTFHAEADPALPFNLMRIRIHNTAQQ